MITMNAPILAVSQDIDLGRIVVIVLFLLGGFVQWLIKWWKEKNTGTLPNFDVMEKIEELKARSQAWLKQTGQGERPLQQPHRVSSPVIASPARLPGKAREIPPPATPPAPPAAPDQIIRIAASAGGASPARRSHLLLDQIAGIGGLKRAIILNEILGPPKALQSEPRQIN